jgi:DNA helicase II / ATP-dependent DNA helicase PcrA
MPVKIEITDDDIKYAERILLKEGETFDVDERVTFIKNFETIDLQAVPGSGKTTALLAKLLILETKLPLPNNAGILILSHTNTAVDEIKERIGDYCTKLFSYPNFIGTIQSFINHFLAVPYYKTLYKQAPFRIDNEIYYESVEKQSILNLKNFSLQDSKNAKYFIKSNKILHTYRCYYENGVARIEREMNKASINISKPKKGKNWADFSIEEKIKIEDWMVKFKKEIFKKGVFHFDDAYFFANVYLAKHPTVIKFLQQRFQFVFVDEMQDMEKHQYDILEKLFYDEGKAGCIYQRIGDGMVSLDKIWIFRDKKLNITGSNRLTKVIAEIVNCFALSKEDKFRVVGLKEGNIKPKILIFNDKNINQVLPIYSKCIQTCIEDGSIESFPKNYYKAIGWTKEKEDDGKLGIVDYFNSYKVINVKTKIDYPTLDCYLKIFDVDKKTLESIRKSILNAIIKILRQESIFELINKRPFTKKQLIDFLNETHFEFLKNFRLKIYQWSIGLAQGKFDIVYQEIKDFIPSLLILWDKKILVSESFINTEEPGFQIYNSENRNKNNNRVNYDGFDIEIGTIHSAKGQTHAATLYLETFYQKNYESERHFNQLKLNEFDKSISKGVREQESVKMAYVGLSRPTHLLCIAIHQDRFDKHLKDIDRNKWDIIVI